MAENVTDQRFPVEAHCKDFVFTESVVMFLKSIINSAVISVDRIGVVPWSLFLWLVWFIIHTVYKKCFKLLLDKIRVEESEKQRLLKIYWTLVFTTITVPFGLQNLSLSLNDLRSNHKYILENVVSRWIFNTNAPSIQTKFSYVLLNGFLLNNACEISAEKGFINVDFFKSELLTLFFVTTFPTRCVLFGIAFLSLINFVRALLEISRLLFTISNIVNAQFLRIMAYVMFTIFTITWFVVYFHTLPTHFLLITMNKIDRNPTNLSALLLLNLLSLWFFYFLEVFSSFLSTILMSQVSGRKTTFDSILYPNGHNQEEFDETELDTMGLDENYGILPPNINANENKKAKENLLALYQTVRCVTIMKRKLKIIRKKLKNRKENSVPD